MLQVAHAQKRSGELLERLQRSGLRARIGKMDRWGREGREWQHARGETRVLGMGNIVLSWNLKKAGRAIATVWKLVMAPPYSGRLTLVLTNRAPRGWRARRGV